MAPRSHSPIPPATAAGLPGAGRSPADRDGGDGKGGDTGLSREVLAIAAVVVVGAIMSILDTTIVNIALQTIGSELHSPLSQVQWIVTGYLLALATVIPVTGWAAERFGPKRVWMASVSLFGLGSVLCGLAWSTGALIGFRVLQGFGGGMIMPVGIIVLAQAAGPKRIGRVMSVIGVPMLLAPVLGPVLGGLIVEHVGWRWIFYVNVPIVLLGLGMAARLLPSGRAGRAGRLDVRGLVLASGGLAVLVFGLSETSSRGGIGDPVVLGPIVAGVALVAAFVRHALNAPNPLIDLRLFRRRAFAAAAATTFLLGGALFGALILLPLYFQVARGESPLEAGLLLAPQGLGAAIAMPLAGRATDRLGGGRIALVGLVFLALGTVAFTQLGAHTSFAWLEVALVVRGLGLGGTMMPAMAAAYAALESPAVPRATSALNVIQRVGGSIGTALLAVVLHGRLADAIPRSAGSGGIGAAGRLPPEVAARIAPGIAHAFAGTFWWALGLTVLAAAPAVVLAAAERPSRVRLGGGAAVDDVDAAQLAA